MAEIIKGSSSISFSDIPEDVQICILSFLNQSDLAKFECTAKRYLSLCRDDTRLWFSMCDRKWGSKTLIQKWGSGKISYKLLYKCFLEYENLIGFWRRCGTSTSNFAVPSVSPLMFFEWGQFYITGSRVSPSKSGTGTYDVCKSPFLWISLTSSGQPVNYLDLEGKFDSSEKILDSEKLRDSEKVSDLISVSLNFMGNSYFMLKEHVFYASMNSTSNGALTKVSSSGNVRGKECEDASGSPGSFPDQFMSELYQYIANRTSPAGNGSSRRQMRRERDNQGCKKLDPQHFVKIPNCTPVPSRPLQGLWKGISVEMNLEFYHITYDEIGGMSCRRVGNTSRFGGHTPVFWSSCTALIEPPFSAEEERLYNRRTHLKPSAETDNFDGPFTDQEGIVSGILHMTSNYDLVIPGARTNPRQGEGRIWRYKNGRAGFGFIRNNYIVDLRHIAEDGHLLDALEVF